MKTLKQRITAFLGAALLSAPVLPVFAYKSGWQNEQGRWRYYINNGYIYGGWQRIQNKMYCFDQYGWMRTGWYSRNGQWYWFSNDGSMPESQWKKIQGKWYWFGRYGAMYTGWLNQNGKTYYLRTNGAMADGWTRMQDGSWYCFKKSGELITGQWISDPQKQEEYYVDFTGKWISTRPAEQAVSIAPSYENSLSGFFQYLADQNDKDALYALQILHDTSGTTQDGRNAGLSIREIYTGYDGLELHNVLEALDCIEASNQIRLQEGLPLFQVNSSMMAISNKCLAWSNYRIQHSSAWNIGENLSWGDRDPFAGWYTKEKQQYYQGENNHDIIGHYLNLINPQYTVTGFAVCSNSIYQKAHEQSFIWSHIFDNKNHNAVTPAQYRIKLLQFMQTVQHQ